MEVEPGRKRLPHFSPLEFPNQSIIVYVTQVVHGRRPLLARPEVVAMLQATWRHASHWLVGRYVVMPDHIHFFCAPNHEPRTPLKRWMSYWKGEATRHWPCPAKKPIWQKDFFDRQLRRGESYASKWQYVCNNPVRAGLVTDPSQWPWQGELHELSWHDPL
jgi:putative transposase